MNTADRSELTTLYTKLLEFADAKRAAGAERPEEPQHVPATERLAKAEAWLVTYAESIRGTRRGRPALAA